ncbi:MAG TPA: GIY-YIG nuclease family protein [Geminicoccaceae bacterium]|nr:GIY-YIG nuclease family protein [Geminicoccaceae bacterium]
MPGLDPGINNRHCFAVPYWVYILANSKKGTLYVGVTRDLVRRVFQHRERETNGFTSRYAVTRLVHYEQYDEPRVAMQREKNLKHWSRDWKIALIEKGNPDWRDRYDEITA